MFCRILLLFVCLGNCQRICSKELPSDMNFMPALSNGVLGTVVGSPVVHVAGMYNGRSTTGGVVSPVRKMMIDCRSFSPC